MSPLLFDHLWQSTAVLAFIGLLTLLFRNNAAAVRHGLWMAASLKFFLPFALLNGLGTYLADLFVITPPPLALVATLYDASQPFSGGPVALALPAPAASLWLLPLGGWLAGLLLIASLWLSRWLKLRGTVKAARAVAMTAPMPVKTSPLQLEPGLVGIFRPVLLLPEGISEKLGPDELRAIVAHEACHMRRRDNLQAALHMLVQAVFWFWPPVWWLSSRLMAEREKACDEAVLAAGNDPQVYAESILKVCKFYVQSPLACAAGVSGADLKQRMEEIMRDAVIARLSLPKKALLLSTGTAMLLAPLMAGLLWSPLAAQERSIAALPPAAPPARTYAATNTAPARTLAAMRPVSPMRPAARDNASLPTESVVPPATGPAAAEPASVLEVAQLPDSPQAPQGAGCAAGPLPVSETHTRPPYPPISRRLGENGTVEMRITVGADGMASDVVLFRSSGFVRLDDAAMAHVRGSWLWEPHRCGYTRIAPVRVVFSLLDAS